MLPDAATVVLRLKHLSTIAFTVMVLLGIVWALIVGRVTGDRAQRERIALLASAAVLAIFLTPLVGVLVVVGVLALYAVVELSPSRLRAIGVWAWVLAVVVLPVTGLGWLNRQGGYATEVLAYATSMGVLRGVAYARDRAAGRLTRPTVERYLTFSLFFPTFVNGPIEGAAAFLNDPWPTPTTAQREFGWRRVARGCAKTLFIAVVGPTNWPARLGQYVDAPAWWLWGWSGLLYAWFFLAFSAWSDVAIGLGALTGRAVPENFAAPWRAADPGDFWRRWHMSFGQWLREHIYLPLGGNRHARVRNVAVVFAVSAGWHVWGALKLFGPVIYPPRLWWGFAVWGLVHAIAVAATPRVTAVDWRRGVAVMLTATFAAWAWLPFFCPASIDLWMGLRLMARMLLLAP